MVKLTFEVWEDRDSTVAMLQRGSKGWQASLTPPLRLLHTYQAESLFTAFQTYYDLMGWGPWKANGMEDRAFTEADIAKPDEENSS